MKRKLWIAILVGLVFGLPRLCSAEPVLPPPPLQANENPDHSLSVPFPLGVPVLPGGIEWRSDGSVRFHWLSDGALNWADYGKPWTIQVGQGPIPPIPGKPQITTPSLAAGVKGAAYLQPLSATGGASPYTWTMTGTVPGLALSTQGLLAGTPTLAGSFPLLVQVADAKQQTDAKQFTLIATEGPGPQPTSGLNVALIGSDPKDTLALTPDQVAILTSRTLRNYLEANCEKDDDGITPAYRVLIRGNDNSLLSKRWQSILKQAPAAGNILAAVKGDRYFLGPLPADTTAVLKTLAEVSGVPADPISVREFPRLRPIPDAMWAIYNPPGRVAIVDGEKRFLTRHPRDLVKQPRGRPLSDFGITLIPRSEWPVRIAALKAANAGLMSLTYGIPPYNQDGTYYCWCNAVAQGMTAMACQQGRPLLVFSAASIGGPLTNYRDVGGMGGDAVNFAQKTGAVRVSLWPSNSISSSYAKLATIKADYPKNRLTVQIADLGATGKIFDEVATCVLLGAACPVGFDWWGHEVLATGLQIENGKPYLILRNSWGQFEDNGFFLLPEGRGKNTGTPDDAQAILSMLAA